MNAAEFNRVFDAALRSQDKYLTVLYRSNDVGHARLGFAIGKKALPKAVSRNRVRRICRESFRHHREHLDAVDIIILAKRSANTASNMELSSSLAKHWDQLTKQASAT